MEILTFTVLILYKKRYHWLAREKLMVIAYHEQGHSKRAIANKFEIEPKQVRKWITNKE